MDSGKILRNLPKIDVLTNFIVQKNGGSISVHLITESCRKVIEKLRGAVLAGEICTLPNLDDIAQLVFDCLNEENTFSLRPVVNATGVVIHTNLGRAILSDAAAENVRKIASSYSTLEYSLQSGERGSRHSHVESLICRITGSQAAMVVNNNAAAIMLALSAICSEREVVVSRGELVEIGGSFRVPKIMAMSGTILKEVGTTNKTKPSDYQNAINDNTAALLKVHTSNFKIVGFTESVDIATLSDISRKNSLPLIYDLGSGLMLDENSIPEIGEFSVITSLKNGADVVCFSGDKLFGGAQAGIIVGKKEFIDAMKSHQLARVVRVDKLTLAALEATLKCYLDPKTAIKEIPVLASLSLTLDELKAKATKLKRRLAIKKSGLDISISRSESQVGGGSAPGENLDSYVLKITSTKLTAQTIERKLREFETPIIARIHKGAVLIDVRTIKESEFDIVCAALRRISGEASE